MKLSDELRGRTKAFASSIVRLYVELPKEREEVRVLGKQLLRSGTSVAALLATLKPSRTADNADERRY